MVVCFDSVPTCDGQTDTPLIALVCSAWLCYAAAQKKTVACDMWTQDRVDHVVEARLYVRNVTSTCFRRRYTLFAENTVAVVTKDVNLYHSMTLLSPDFDNNNNN